MRCFYRHQKRFFPQIQSSGGINHGIIGSRIINNYYRVPWEILDEARKNGQLAEWIKSLLKSFNEMNRQRFVPCIGNMEKLCGFSTVWLDQAFLVLQFCQSMYPTFQAGFYVFANCSVSTKKMIQKWGKDLFLAQIFVNRTDQLEFMTLCNTPSPRVMRIHVTRFPLAR